MPEIAVPPGQLNLKGPQAPNVVNRWFSTTTGIAFTGLALTLAISISVPVGALTITGQANVNPLAHPAGAITFAGLAPTPVISSAGTTISNPAGSLAYTGLAPIVRVGDFTVEIPAGQLVIKGPARPAIVPQPPAGSLALTGRVLNVQVDTPGSAVSMPAGSLALTGLALDLFNTKTLAIPAGTLTLSGQYVGIQFTQPAAGSLVFQGLAPTIAAQTTSIVLPRGSLVFGSSTLVPSLRYDFVIAVPVGSLALTGQQPNVGTPETLVLQAGSLPLTGQTPTIDWSTGLAVGTLTVTGLAPQALLATGAPGIPVGSLVFQGYELVPIHSNGTVFSSTVQISRSLSHTGTITRTVSSEVQR